MSEWRVLRKADTGEVVLARAKWCASYWCHLRGLQFVLRLPTSQGILFVTDHEGIVHTAIHMFFMFFSIGVIWLDKSGKVVDKKLAKPWRPYYAPKSPAQYYIEANTDLLERVKIGERLKFDEVAT